MNDDLRIFRKTVRQFIPREFAPHHERWCQQHRPDAEAWNAAGRVGMLLTDIPEEYGGAGGTFAHEAVVIEELAQAGINFGSGVHSIVAHYILAYGTQEQKRKWLPCMARGESVGAIAMTEPAAGSDLQGIKTSAHRDGDQYVVNGSKTFITTGCLAGLICLAAKTDPRAADPKVVGFKERYSLLMEAKIFPGSALAARLKKSGRTPRKPSRIFFDDVRVP